MSEQTEKVETAEKTYTEAQFAGLLADKQAEVRRRQEAEGRVSELEKELAARQKVDPHAPSDEDDPDNKPLTMNDLVQLLGIEPGAKPEAVKTDGRAAGGPAGTSLPWFGRQRQVPLSEMSDAELDKLAEEIS